MEDKGKKLYEMWRANFEKQGIEVDAWNDLTPEDQTAWHWTAEEIMQEGL